MTGKMIKKPLDSKGHGANMEPTWVLVIRAIDEVTMTILNVACCPMHCSTMIYQHLASQYHTWPLAASDIVILGGDKFMYRQE